MNGTCGLSTTHTSPFSTTHTISPHPHKCSFATVVAFLVSPFSNIERPWKPFNPILGETFEWKDGDLQFLCEQVCHHPPVSAGHGENKHFVYDIVSAPKTKFLGNSIDIYPIGRTRLQLKKSGDLYWHSPPNSKAHNLIVGTTWIDAYGDFKVGWCGVGVASVL